MNRMHPYLPTTPYRRRVSHPARRTGARPHPRSDDMTEAEHPLAPADARVPSRWESLAAPLTTTLAGVAVIVASVVGHAPGESAPSSPTDLPAAAAAAERPESSAERRSGPDRVATALAVTRHRDESRNLYGAPAQPSVVLASAERYPDALTATALADRWGAPLLLTPSTGLDPRVARELREHLPPGSTVRLVGGEASLSAAVADAVRAGGWQVERVAGADRYATAAEVAGAVATGDGDERCDVILATGTDFADGTAAAAATRAQRPLLLTDGDALPAATAAALARCADAAGGVGSVTAVGGPATRAAATLSGAAARLRLSSAAGADRYATAAALLPGTEDGDGWLVLTTGEDFPDALVGGTYGVPVLLSTRDALPPVTAAALAERRGQVRRLVVVGGTQAVSDAVLTQAADLLGATVERR